MNMFKLQVGKGFFVVNAISLAVTLTGTLLSKADLLTMAVFGAGALVSAYLMWDIVTLRKKQQN